MITWKSNKAMAAIVAGSMILATGFANAAVTYTSLFTISNTGDGLSGLIDGSDIVIGDQFNISFVFDETKQSFGGSSTPGSRYMAFPDDTITDIQITPAAGNSGDFVPAWGEFYGSFQIHEAGGFAQAYLDLGFIDGSEVGYTGGDYGPGDADLYRMIFEFKTPQTYDAAWGTGTPASVLLSLPASAWTPSDAYIWFENFGLRSDYPTVAGSATFAPIPEPGSATLLILCGMVGLIRRRR
jgi:hypothetical protein